MAFAKTTTVSIGKTKDEIQRSLIRAGASGFAEAQRGREAFYAFQFNHIGVKIKFKLPLPPGANATALDIKKYEQECRTKWRCLLLVIKAKIESVESGIETFEQAFLPHIALKDGSTVGEKAIPALTQFNERPASLLLGL